METHVGKFEKVNLQGLSIEDWCASVCSFFGIPLDEYNKNFTDLFIDVFYKEYLIVDNVLYHIIEDTEVGEDYISIIQPNSDGTYSYVLQFYNGGCGFFEALEEEINML